jgi:hypothetical protein
MKDLKTAILKTEDWLQYIYLFLFTGIVLKYYLNTTLLENSYSYDFYRVVKWTLVVFVVVNLILAAIKRQFDSWLEIVFIVALIACAAVVSYTIGEDEVLDIVLLIAGAKNVSWKKIAYCYLCVAVVVQLVAFYAAHTGIVPDMTYETDRGIRQSFGIIYPTDFAAHVLFIFMVYVTLRESRLTFAEIALMFVAGYAIYHRTYARNDFICIVILCLILAVIKLLRVMGIQLSKHQWLKYFGIIMLVVAIFCIIAVTFYDPSSELYQKLDNIFSNRISLSYQGLAQYGIQPFGSVVIENNTILGYNFFLDSSFIRIAIRYGWVFLSLITFVYMLCFERAVENYKDYTVIVLIVMLVFGFTEHHMLEVAYCPVWYMLFSRIKPDKLAGRSTD